VTPGDLIALEWLSPPKGSDLRFVCLIEIPGRRIDWWSHFFRDD